MCNEKMKKHFSKYKYELVDYLLKSVLFDDVVAGAVRVSKSSDWKLLRKDRSLYNTPKHIGLPIGNLTSQLFSNIYMDVFDHFIKDDLGIKHYGRYVDDFVIVHHDKMFLQKLIETSGYFLSSQLGLEIHPKKIYLQHYSKGVGFLGTFVKPYRVYVGNRMKGNFYKFIYEINHLFEQRCCNISPEEIRSIRATFNSYLGMFSKFNTRNLKIKIISNLHQCFYQYFSIDTNYTKIKVIPCKK
jgi:hypothetical protein